MAASIKQQLGVDAEIAEGSKGIFRVEADGKTVFDKYAEGRFPDPGEVEAALGKLSK